MRFKSFLGVALCTAALMAVGASAALAGEVKGPPNTQTNTNFTPVHFHVAASICSFNGLNDFTANQGQQDFQVQNFGVGVAGLTPSEPQDPHEFNPGSPDGCRGVPPS
jgi:opacity protein-like surface antigen